MTIVTVPKDYVRLFEVVRGVAEIRDELGNLLGHFASPIPDQEELRGRVATKFDPEAARKRLESERHGCLTTEEVLKKLRAAEPAA